MGALLLVCAMGAESEGCSAELESDGSAQSWAFGEIPEAGEPQAMTCEWLEAEDNCWRELIDRARECVPSSEVGSFDGDRKFCSFDDGSEIEFDGQVNEPDGSTTHFPIIQHRFVDAQGDPCFTVKFLGIAHVAYDVGGDVGVLQATSLTQFQMTCPDGTTYANSVEGTCPDTGGKWLAQELPGYEVICDGDDDICRFDFKGSNPGRETVASCGF